MKHEQPLLEGSWQPFKAEMEGALAPELVVQRTTLTVRGSRYVVDFAGETADKGRIVLEEAEPHGVIRLTSTHGETDGRLLEGIYQLRGDLLRICFALSGSLPTDFTAPAASQRYLVLYRRKA